MKGVNDELMPLVKMTAPSGWTSKPLSQWPVGSKLFSSIILLFGFIPVDVHTFELEKVSANGFEERSRSLSNREWRHKRTITQLGVGCLVTDEVEFSPRVRLFGAIMAPVYRAIFAHRHKRLKARFGENT